VHCEHGHDRTGMIVALYRVCFDGWGPETAYQEMINMGHNPDDHVTQGTDVFFWQSTATRFCDRVTK
jgi:protein tyrosine/serine phosphatase